MKRMMRRMKTLRLTLLHACLLLSAGSAIAATPERVVLGVTLNAPFALPACALREVTIASRICFNPAMINRKDWGAEEYFVSIPVRGTPPFVRGEIGVYVVGGIVEAVKIGTWGIQGQAGALADLKKTYGEPTRAWQEHRHRQRSRFPSLFAEWDISDVWVRLDGTTATIDWGSIEIQTRRYQKRIAAFEKGAATGGKP